MPQGPRDWSGYAVASAGDIHINGDGFDDILIGASQADVRATHGYAGDSYVVFGKAGGFGASVDLSAIAAGTGGFAIYGAVSFNTSGRANAMAGDNGDGFGDLAIEVRLP